MNEMPVRIFASAASCERVDAGVGVIWWAYTPRGQYLLRVLDYDLAEPRQVNAAWIDALFRHGIELVREHRPLDKKCAVWVEQGGLLNALTIAMRAWHSSEAAALIAPVAYDLIALHDWQTAAWPATLDARAAELRPLINSGTTIKIERGLRQFSFRALRTNHLVRQLRDHRPGVPESAGELLNAFMLGLLLTRDGDLRRSLPEPELPESHEEGLLSRMAAAVRRVLPTLPAPAPSGPPMGKVLLTVGPHVVDGKPVVIEPRTAGDSHGWLELPYGRHTIDSKNELVLNPNAGVWIPVGRP